MSEPQAPEDLRQWSKVITPHRGWLDVRWRELWRYRDLIYLFVRRDFVATYKQTILGPLWYLLQPLFTTLVFTIVFSRIGQLSTNGIPPILFYMSGVVTWNYFADCMVKTATTFSANAGMFGKVYFPRLTVPISIVTTNLIALTIQFGFFLCIYGYFLATGHPVYPNWRCVILPILVLQMAMLGLGMGCLISSLTTRYRDLAMLVGFGTQLWMYASCVVFPLSQIQPEKRMFFILNPMVSIIETLRFAFMGAGVVEIWQLGVSFIISLLIFLAGVTVFSRVEKTFMDTI